MKSNSKKLVPLHHLVLLRPEKDRSETSSGIVLPDNREDRSPRFGEVLACGPGTTKASGVHVPMQVAAGQRIMYGRHAGTEIEQDGEKLRLVNQDEILAVVEY